MKNSLRAILLVIASLLWTLPTANAQETAPPGAPAPASSTAQPSAPAPAPAPAPASAAVDPAPVARKEEDQPSLAATILGNIKSKAKLQSNNSDLQSQLTDLQSANGKLTASNQELTADRDLLAKEVDALQTRLSEMDTMLGVPKGTCETSPLASLQSSFNKKVSASLIDVAATAGVDATTLPKALSSDTDLDKAKSAGLTGLDAAQANMRAWFKTPTQA